MQKKHIRLIYKFIALLILLLFIASRTLFFRQSGSLEDLASAFAYPFLLTAHKITSPLKDYFEKRKSYNDMLKELESTRLENENILLENVKLKASLHHRSATDELVDFQARYDLSKGIFSKVLLRNMDDFEHYYLVNRGVRDGVRRDMVFIYKFQLVGRVSEVFSHHAKVTLITDAKSKIAAYANMTTARGIVLGNNTKNRCELGYVNHLSKVEKDDFVLSSGQGLVFPEGFCLGKVISHETESFLHKVELEPMVDFTTLEFGILLDRKQIINF